MSDKPVISIKGLSVHYPISGGLFTPKVVVRAVENVTIDIPQRTFFGLKRPPLERPSGCVFHTRCPIAMTGRCNTAVPQMGEVSTGHAAACFAVEDQRLAS